MEENIPQQQLFPCPYCKRKFIAKSLEIHLKSHNKNNPKPIKSNYDNQAFIDAVDRAMAEEEKRSTQNKSNQNKVVDSNQLFLEKLESELKKDEEGIAYQTIKKPKKTAENKNNVNQAFLDKLESELKKEEEGIAYQPSRKKKFNEGMSSSDAHKAFLERLDIDFLFLLIYLFFLFNYFRFSYFYIF